MKRSMLVVLFGVICFLAGLASKPVVNAWAQGKIQAEEDAKTSTKAVPGKAMYFSAEEIKKRFVDAAPQGATHLAWDPAYRFHGNAAALLRDGEEDEFRPDQPLG